MLTLSVQEIGTQKRDFSNDFSRSGRTMLIFLSETKITGRAKELSSPTRETQSSRLDQENKVAFLSVKLPPDPFFQKMSYISQAAVVSMRSHSESKHLNKNILKAFSKGKDMFK